MRLLFVALVFFQLSGFAQYPQFYHHGEYQLLERFLSSKENNLHSSIKPYRCREIAALGYEVTSDTTRKGRWKRLYEKQDIFSVKDNGFAIVPEIELMGGAGFSAGRDVQTYNPIGGGVRFVGLPGEKWSLSGGVSYLNIDPLSYRDSLMSGHNIIPGYGYAIESSGRFSGWNWEGKVTYEPNKFFDLELGKSKAFFGDGYRSLLLSDNAVNYPYFRIDTKVWNIQYTNLYSLHFDVRNSNGIFSKYRWKYATSHYLDWNISKSVSLAFFESVVWQARDTLLNRQFDINYLNPVIFYRPVEYSLGSSDNSIMGLNLKVDINERNTIYGQFVIDEFLLSKIKADFRHLFNRNDTTILWGWWANKYGVQLGYKGIDLFGVKGLSGQTELNLLRPYTFTHGVITQNYGHFNQPLAHPLGANFLEHVNFLWFELPASRLRMQLNWALYGTDSTFTSYGGDLYKPYTARPGNYEHFIGQGLRNNSIFMDLSWEKTLNPEIRLKFRGGVRWRQIANSINTEDSWLIYCGIRTDLWNRYEDY